MNKVLIFIIYHVVSYIIYLVLFFENGRVYIFLIKNHILIPVLKTEDHEKPTGESHYIVIDRRIISK